MIAATAARHEPICRALATDLALEWAFDPVYCAVSASLDPDAIARVSERLARDLPRSVDRKSLAAQDARVKDLAMWAGGVERRQRLLHAALDDGVALFATLWPWTEDEGCTVRVGLFHPRARLDDRDALGALLRAWFSVPTTPA